MRRPGVSTRTITITMTIALALAREAGATEMRSGPPGARREWCPSPALKNAVETQPFEVFGRGVALLYERFVLPPRISVAGLAGARETVTGDYTSLTLDAGAEVRVWFLNWSPLAVCAGSMSGPYAGLRFDFGYVTLHDRVLDRSAGSLYELSPTWTLGYRAVLAAHVALTPWIGAGTRTDVDGNGWGTWTRPTIALGFAFGWLF